MSKAINTLCDFLEPIMVFFRDVPENNGGGTIPLLYEKLRSIIFIYILYSLADLLHDLSILCKFFHSKYVDVTTFGSIVRIKIENIFMLYIMENTDMNECNYNKNTYY